MTRRLPGNLTPRDLLVAYGEVVRRYVEGDEPPVAVADFRTPAPAPKPRKSSGNPRMAWVWDYPSAPRESREPAPIALPNEPPEAHGRAVWDLEHTAFSPLRFR